MASEFYSKPKKNNNPFEIIKPEQLTIELLATLETTQDTDTHRNIPSPSTVDDCIRRLVYNMAGVVKTEGTPVAALLAAEQGKSQEVIVEKILTLMGREYITQLPVDILEGGTCDFLVDDEEVWDVKRLGLFRYLRLIQYGLKEAHPSYYSQLQLYMAGLGKKRAVLLAFSADHSAVTYYWNRRGWSLETRVPPLWTETIEYDSKWIDSRVKRGKEISHYIKLNNPKKTPRDYNPLMDKFPCSLWCSWKTQCIRDG